MTSILETQDGPRPERAEAVSEIDVVHAAGSTSSAVIVTADDDIPAERTQRLAPLLGDEPPAARDPQAVLEQRRHEHLLDAVHVLLNVVNFANLPDIDWGTLRHSAAQIVLCGHVPTHLAKTDQLEILHRYASHFAGEIVERTYDVDRRDGRESWVMRGEQAGVVVWIYADCRADGKAAAA